MKRTFLLMVCLVMLAGLAHARHEGSYLNEVTTRLITPHTDWATPYAVGKPKVLFIVPRTLAPREVVELWQRFGLDFQAFTVAHSGLFSFESIEAAAQYDLGIEGTSIQEKTDDLLGKLNQQYDAIVLGNASFDILPREAQYRILKQVSDGAGLVFTFGRQTRLPLFKKVTQADRALITDGVPLSAIDYFDREDVRKGLRVAKAEELPSRVVETFDFGKGRIAVLNYGAAMGTYYGGMSLTPPTKYSLRWQGDYEVLLSLVYKALVWSTTKLQPQVLLSKLPPDGCAYSRSDLPQPLPVELTSRKEKPLAAKLVATVRDRTNTVEAKQELPVTLQPGTNPVNVPLPAVKAGDHYLDLVLTSPAGTEAWGTLALSISNPLRLEHCSAGSGFLERGQTGTLNVSFSAPAPAKTILRATLTDTNNRLYFSRSADVATGLTQAPPLKLDISGATTIASRLHVDLLVGGQVVDAADEMIFVPRRESDEFRSIIWGVGGDHGLTWLAMQQLRAAGFTDHLAHPSPEGTAERLMALNDMPLVCYTYRIMSSTTPEGWRKDAWGAVREVADGCFYNPEVQAKASESVRTRIANVTQYGPSLYSLGDENFFDYNYGFSPIAIQSFRQMLQRKYKDLATLNAAWGASYASWEAIVPVKRDEALKQGLWPLLHEHMSFIESEYADYHHFLREEIRKVVPGAWVGAEGSVPGDLEKTIAGMEIWGPYSDKRGNELLRSLAPQALVRGNWWGGYSGSHGGRAGAALLWNQLISGAVNTSLFYAATGSEGLFRTDLGYAKYFEDMLPELHEIYGGIGQLFAASHVPDDGIAILWSQASEHSAGMFGAVGSPAASQGNLLGLLDRNGYGYRFVTTSMVERGDLQKRKFRVLFLPCVQALSEAEASQIAAFAQAGGVVIADVGPGSMTGNCRPLWRTGQEWQGQMDSLLGVKRQGEPRSKSSTVSLELPFGEGVVSLKDFSLRPDASVVGTGKAQVEGTPVFITGQRGNGQIIFLNFTFPNPEHPASVPFLADLLGQLGVTPAFRLSDSKGYMARRFANGGLTMIGISREAKTAKDTMLELAAPAQVYDIRSGKSLGKQSRIALPTSGPQNRIYALLPEAASAPVVKVAATAQRGTTSAVTITLPQPGGVSSEGRIIRLEVQRPDGKEAQAYRAYPTIKGGAATASIPWAYSDAAGAWTIRAVDVATGISATATVKVQ